ncbi:MAG: phospholipid carrier-dependent glycosyltransferase [Gemmataceae bacterium]|nr:phospholipid carrier-dependent glycosyltransferase [Gemmata sp.]MDW8197827.1 phospholipid carrier-dependent glycosyltransferase [Gemmataceae bacterium]
MNVRHVLTIAASVAIIAAFWYRGERFLAHNGPTFDEAVHLTAGYSYWTTGRFHLNHEDPPLMKLLWAWPLVIHDRSLHLSTVMAETPGNHWSVSTALVYQSDLSPQQLLNPARRVNLAVGCVGILLVGWWAYRLWNSCQAGVVAAAFAAFDPNWLALACVLSTDTGLAVFTLLSCYLLWEYAAKPSHLVLWGIGVSVGLALATKFSAVAVVCAVVAAALVHQAWGGRLALPNSPAATPARVAFVEFTFRVSLIAGVTLACTYGIIHFDDWGRGLKFQLTRSEHGDGRMYLLGELSSQGWYHYFVVLLPLKLPLGLLVAWVAVFATRAVGRGSRLVFVVVPPLVFFVLASYARVNLGLRVVLPVLPFLYLLAAGLATIDTCRWPARVLLGLCVAWCALSAWRHDPYPLSYFNELAGGPRGGMRIAADSNLDWGQGLPALRDYLQAQRIDMVYLSYFGTDRPESYGIRFQALPTYGRVGPPGGETIPESAARHILVVSVNNLLGVYLSDPTTYAWLRGREPTAIVADCLYVYDLAGDIAAIAHVRQLTLK